MALLELRAAGRTFPVEPPFTALAGATLSISQGEFVAIQGPSGSGKSTLLNLLTLIDRPTAGSYLIDGIDTMELNEPDLAAYRCATFGFVFQAFHLIAHRTAVQNVELGLVYHRTSVRDRHRRALAALEMVGIAHRADRLASKLSGGERQRVAIARAIVADPPVIVADEPTGNLDSASGQVVVNLLRDLNAAGRSIILVTHEPAVAAVAPRRVVLRDGRIVSDNRLSTADVGTASAPLAPLRPHLGWRDLLREAADGVRGRAGRSAALMTAVAVAVALVVATAGLAQTASSQVSERFDAARNREVDADVPVLPRGAPAVAGLDAAGLDADVEQRVRTIAGVDHAGVIGIFDQRRARVAPDRPEVRVNMAGASMDALAAVNARVDWAHGHPRTLGRGEGLIGTAPAADLDLAPLSEDPSVLVDGVPIAVVGIIRSVARSGSLLASIVLNPHEASRSARPTDVDVVVLTRSGAARQVALQVRAAVDPIAPQRLDIRAPPDPATLRDEIQSDLTDVMLALAAVSALASVIGVANAMMVSVVERIGEFGLRRAIGARPVHILGQTTAEALVLGLSGGVAGYFVGAMGVLVVTAANHWQPVLDVRLALLALLGGAGVGVLGGLAAAMRASRIRPSDALRR
jgi:macrolide transport system ATP-binding/permease protein